MHSLDSPCLQEELDAALEDILKSIKLSEKGVFVQASTLGSLEALLSFLRDSKIPVSRYTGTLIMCLTSVFLCNTTLYICEIE